jgi:hypothetical protein
MAQTVPAINVVSRRLRLQSEGIFVEDIDKNRIQPLIDLALFHHPLANKFEICIDILETWPAFEMQA